MSQDSCVDAAADVGSFSTENIWSGAISNWLDGNKDALTALLLNHEGVIPAFAREFLSDLASGNVTSAGGRPKERHARHERMIVASYFNALEIESGKPRLKRVLTPTPTAHIAALSNVAKQYGVTPTKIRGIVERMRSKLSGEGSTLEPHHWIRVLSDNSQGK